MRHCQQQRTNERPHTLWQQGKKMMYAHSPPAFDLSSSAAPTPPPPPLPLPLPLLHEGEADDAIYNHLGNKGQPSLIPEYDLGGEWDLFKAPEPIIEEPLLTLDSVAAAISIMSCYENTMDDTIQVSDMGLSKVMYECEKELMEKSVIEETISELLDAIPMLQVDKVPGELRASPLAGECSLQKSVSSECLNSADWMNGPVRPNFLDFQGLDFEAAFRLRKKWNFGANTPRLVTTSDLKTEERKQRLSRYRMKKFKRNFGRKIKYACRKAMADSQPRTRGRFSKMHPGDMLKPRK
ncbi:uncharacterized protein [Lolium perenne]|uniref:uncharacterized protein isoform X2 n=1 Tax=Lolium perenne TaxID=4522 RepID=UPI0021F60AF4|nr:uncharacterized protein LOC127340607 isoform X2 [Lolium perenne]